MKKSEKKLKKSVPLKKTAQPKKEVKPGFTAVPSFVKSSELEERVLAYWDSQQIFEKVQEQNKEKPLFTFYDGPPYATGKPHYGHVLQSAIKDTVLRYKTMQGYYIPRTVGWDCHGLPVEVLVEKELGLKTKQDVEKFGIEKFNHACREVVFRYINEFTSTLKRIGRWADYHHGYATLNKEYMEVEWGVFKQLWDKDLIYKAFKSTPYCVRCATPLSNHEVTMSYKDKVDQTVYVKLRIRGSHQQFLLVWTTTPWTLPGNSGVAFNPELEYVSVEHEQQEIIVAKLVVPKLFGEQAQIVKTWTTNELQQVQYEPLYPADQLEPSAVLGELSKAYRVVPANYVTANDGTGLVHIAPAFGEEDADVGKKYDLPVLRVVDTQGHFVSSAVIQPGKYIFGSLKAIIEDLKNRGLLFKEESYTHSYPFCWRCDTPLIYYALDTWFVKVSDLKNRMLELNEDIHWTPTHVKHGRFGKGIESAPDWAVSRNRFWSVPMPIWECDSCSHRVCIGSVEELKQYAKDTDLPDLHRPYVDEVKWQCEEKNCSGTMQRIPEVLDVWFDAGSMPYASPQASFPADFIIESIEQTRLWFYVLHVLGTAIKDKPAFKNAIGSGIIFAEDGQKLSKKLKNYPEIEPTLEKYGADVLRFYLLTSSSLGEPYRFSEKEMSQLRAKFYMTLWNVYSFFMSYAHVKHFVPRGKASSSAHILDNWLLARLHQLENDVITKADEYQIDTAARMFIPFMDDLSNWYLRRSRERFQRPGSDVEKEEAYGTLYAVLVRLSELLSPFMPFVTEEMYRNLTGEASVHMASLSKTKDLTDITDHEKELISQMNSVRDSVALALALRAQAKIKVRQPLASVTIQADLPEALQELIKDEVNVKEVVVGPEIGLDTILTSALKQEGLAREIIRHGQVLRKKAGYALNDRIKVRFKTSDTDIQQAFEAHQTDILTALQAEIETNDDIACDQEQTVSINGQDVTIGVSKGT